MNQVAHLAASGFQIVLTHGNGPVVGNIVLRGDAGWHKHGIPPMPLDVCGADSQGGMGYMIQQALQNAFYAHRLQRPVASIVTQVLVAADDPAFQNPTKPIGPFYSEEQARQLGQEKGWIVVEDAKRGWRRVVPSPIPQQVVELDVIKTLVRSGVITIALGGGGIPVIQAANGQLRGVEAVIDKDRASALLGRLIKAHTLIIVTSVDRVYRHFGTSEAEPLAQLSTEEAAGLLAAGEFPAGSMGPKIEAARTFLAHGGREVIITDPPSLMKALQGSAGTRLVSALS
jgi:carbamate kinase